MVAMRFRLRLFHLPVSLALLTLGVVVTAWLSDIHIAEATSSNHSSDLSEIPPIKTALVPGCSKTLPNGRSNLYFTYRINAASELYSAGLCETFIVSGDNHRKGYDEPSMMKQALIEQGIPAESIYCDYAGFRTLDSVVRAKTIFGQSQLLFVSQRFHNERALYIAENYGIKAFAYNAEDVNRLGGLKTRIREKLARVKTLLDLYLLNTQPKFGGPPVPIKSPASSR